MKKRGKVLIIEDELDWQEILKEYLEEAGFYVEVASNHKAGLEKVKKDNFHFATIDLQLHKDTRDPSEYEGWKILKEIIEYRTDRTMPTMVITGYEKDYEKLKKIKNLEGTFFMAKKHFDKKEFIKKVVNAVDALDVRFFDDKKEK